MISSFLELNDEQIDALREVGNIGAGNAATSLGILLGENVYISVPNVRIETYNDVIAHIGDPEELIVTVMVRFTGEAVGTILFILSMEDAKDIMSILIGTEANDDIPGLSDIKISAIKEIGNILGSSYLGSIAELTGLKIDISVPHLAIDMTGAILAAPIAEYGAKDSKVLFIEESFSTDRRELDSYVVMFTDVETLNDIMNKLGLEL